MRKQLYYHLANTAAVSAVVGDRIYPQRVPTSDALPYIVFDITSREVEYEQDGYTTYNKLYVDISCCATTIAVCADLKNKVFTALNIQNTQIGEAGDKQEVCRISLLSESDNYFLLDGSEDGVREITQTYSINYMEA